MCPWRRRPVCWPRLDGVGFDDELARLAEQSVGGSHVRYAYRGRQRRGPANAESGMFLAADDALSALDLLHRLTAYVPERNLANNPIQVSEQLSTSDEWCYAPLLFGYTNYARAGFRTGRLKYTDMPSRASTGSANVSGLAGSLLAGAGIAVGHCGRPRRRPGLRPLARLGRRAARGLLRQRRPAGQRRGLGRRAAERRHPGLLHRDPATFDGAYVRPRLPGFVEFQDTASPLVTAARRRELTDTELVRRLDDLAERLLVHT